jgi:hypothetical protein
LGPVTGRALSSVQAAKRSSGEKARRAEKRIDEMCCGICILDGELPDIAATTAPAKRTGNYVVPEG